MARVAPRILIAEDEDRLRRVLAMLLSNAGYKLSLASDGEEALALFEKQQPDVVVTDVKMPKVDGMELLKKMREQSPETPVIVITAFGSIESAVEAMKAGAIDYITKPFEEERLKLAIERALELRRILSENKFLRTELKHKLSLDTIVAESQAMKSVLGVASEVAGSNATVIVAGESGTGKELITRFIHLNSARQHGPFVAINCAAIPDNLLESELFGYERGAFTGAVDRKTGKFEQAAGGTLFLDEIGELSPNVQAKVLRAIEQREVVRLGGLKAIKIDIRILCATNKDLEEEVRAGRFREDLYYRLSVFPIVIPPLRERPEDIMPLTELFLKRYCSEIGKRVPGIPEESRDWLMSQRWEGNVRELQNSIERAVILMKGNDLTADLLVKPSPQRAVSGAGAGAQGEAAFKIPAAGFSLDEHEKTLLLQALERAKHNKTAAAKMLGLTRATLRYRLEKYGINSGKK